MDTRNKEIFNDNLIICNNESEVFTCDKQADQQEGDIKEVANNLEEDNESNQIFTFDVCYNCFLLYRTGDNHTCIEDYQNGELLI